MLFAEFPLLDRLTQTPHRGAGTAYAHKAAEQLGEELSQAGFLVEKQSFRTPATYVSIVYWLIGGLLVGLLTVPWGGVWSVLIIVFFAINGWLYFDWRPSLCLYFPPLVEAHNVIGTLAQTDLTKPTLVLMAHYDTAPVSALYQKQTKNGFRNSLRLSMALIALAVPVVVVSWQYPDWTILTVLRWLLSAYFVGQAYLGTVGFWQKGYTNGASDNATGVVAAIETAKNLKTQLKHLQVEIVLTSAEEAGMIGAYHYWRSKMRTGHPYYLINFDTLGAGQLKVITQTGSVSSMTYDNEVTQAALHLMASDARFAHLKTDSWHTADFDTAWFVRAGVSCVTLAALDAQGLMPRIHRPEDTLSAVNIQPMQEAITLATAMAVTLERQFTHKNMAEG